MHTDKYRCITPQELFVRQRLRQFLPELNGGETTESVSKAPVFTKHVSAYSESSFIEKSSEAYLEAKKDSVRQRLWHFAHQIGPALWYIIDRDAPKRAMIERGYFIRTIITHDTVADKNWYIRPTVQWMSPNNIPAQSSWKHVYDETRTCQRGVTYVLGWCGLKEADAICISLPLTKQEMFGDIKFLLTDDFKDPPAFLTVCGNCNKKVSKAQLCGKCLFTNYCSKECQRAHWKEHTATCSSIKLVMSGLTKSSHGKRQPTFS